MSGKDSTPVNRSGMSIRVLIVDDDEAHAQAVAESLQKVNYDCTVASSGQRAIALIESQTFDVIITDLMMDDVDGLEILRKSKEELPAAEVILLTGHASIKTAVAAGQHGVHTYLTKPLDITELRHAVEKASSRIRLLQENAELSRRLDEKFGYEGVIGNSPAMHRVIEKLRSVAPTDSTVLILGESGTGKELAARALHQNSERKNKPFVPLNISALPEACWKANCSGTSRAPLPELSDVVSVSSNTPTAEHCSWTKLVKCRCRRRSNCFVCWKIARSRESAQTKRWT